MMKFRLKKKCFQSLLQDTIILEKHKKLDMLEEEMMTKDFD